MFVVFFALIRLLFSLFLHHEIRAHIALTTSRARNWKNAKRYIREMRAISNYALDIRWMDFTVYTMPKPQPVLSLAAPAKPNVVWIMRVMWKIFINFRWCNIWAEWDKQYTLRALVPRSLFSSSLSASLSMRDERRVYLKPSSLNK